MAVTDPAGSLVRLVLAAIVVLWLVAAGGLLLEGAPHASLRHRNIAACTPRAARCAPRLAQQRL